MIKTTRVFSLFVIFIHVSYILAENNFILSVLNQSEITERFSNYFKSRTTFKASSLVDYGMNLTISALHLWLDLYSSEAVQCYRDLHLLQKAINAGEDWAFQVVDSIGKIKESMIWPGAPDVCIHSSHTPFHLEKRLHYTKSQFCYLNLKTDEVNVIEIGVCLPESCSENFINKITSSLNAISPDFLPKLMVNLNCYSKYVPDTFSILSFMFVGLLIAIVIVGTVMDILHQRNTSPAKILNPKYICSKFHRTEKPSNNDVTADPTTTTEKINHQKMPGIMRRLVQTFSVYTNLPETFSPAKCEQIRCLHGIRAISILWVIYGHCFIYTVTIDNGLIFLPLSEWFSFNFLMGALNSIDTFFLLCGFLCSYCYVQKIQIGKPLTWFQYYLYRFVRISPTYYFSVIFVFWLSHKHRRNTYDVVSEVLSKKCSESWYKNFLYINNYERIEDMCSPAMWFVATEMQLVWISPIFVLSLIRTKYFGRYFCIISAIATSAYKFWTSYNIGFILYPKVIDVNFVMNMIKNDAFGTLYIKPEFRITPFAIGLFFGWLLINRSSKLKISKILLTFTWVLVAVGVLVSIFGPYYYRLENEFETAAFVGAQPLLWSTAIALVIFLCETGNGGIVNRILCWPIWKHISRLTFCIYLTHTVMLTYVGSSTGQMEHVTIPGKVFLFFFIIQISFVSGLMLHLLIEFPCYKIKEVIEQSIKKEY